MANTTSHKPSFHRKPHELPNKDQSPKLRIQSLGSQNQSCLKRSCMIISLLTSTFLFGLDNTVTANLQAVVARRFSSVEKLPWISVAYLLGGAGTNLFWGQLYSQYNAKWLFLGSLFMFEVGSILCGTADNIDAFIVGRAICGLGGAGVYVGVSTMIGVTTEQAKRPLLFSLVGFSRALGTVSGPIIGGSLSDSRAGWRWAFYINPCIAAASLPAYLFLLPSYRPNTKDSFLPRLLMIDWLGTLLLCGLLTSFLMAVDFGGNLYAWNSGQIIALFVVSAFLTLTFLTQQYFAFLTKVRLFPVQFIVSPLIMSLFVTTAAGIASIFIPVYFIPLYYEFVRNYSALSAGVQLLPYIIFNVVILIANGIIMSKKPYYVPWYLMGGVLVVVGSALFYTTLSIALPNADIYGFSILLGLGGGAFSQVAFSIMPIKVERSLLPLAMGFCAFAQLAGPSFALCISNAVFLNEATNGIQALAPSISRTAIEQAISGISQTRQIPGLTTEEQQVAVKIVVNALRKVFLLPLSGGAITIVLAVSMACDKWYGKSTSNNEHRNDSSQ